MSDAYAAFADLLRRAQTGELDVLEEDGLLARWGTLCEEQLQALSADLDADETDIWTLERNTWALVQALYSERLSDAPAEPSSSKNPYTPPLTVVQRLIEGSKDLIELSAIRDWLHSIPSSLNPAEIRRGYLLYTKLEKMQNATLATLPTEVLDLIFEFVEAGQGRQKARNTFRSLTLVSRDILPIARRFLWAQPLSTSSIAWPRAIGLLSTLRAQQHALGRQVRSLAHLGTWMDRLENTATEAKSLSFQIRGQTRAFSWGLAMLKACPKLYGVDLSFHTSLQLTLVHRALSPSVATLKEVRLQTCTKRPLTGEMVHKVGEKLKIDLHALQRLEIVGLSLDKLDTTNTSPRLPFKVEALKLVLPMVPTVCILQFLPTSLAALRCLALSTSDFSPSSINSLAKLVGPHLHKLVLSPPPAYFTGNYRLYGREYGLRKVPPELFSLLPHIRHLEVHNAHFLSVGRIEVLVKSSPYLAVLCSSTCVWTSDSLIVDTAPGWQARLFPQAEIATLLTSFSHLKDVDLGLIPVLPEHPRSALLDPLKAKGIEVKYWTCQSRCPSCGDYH